jgi:hypothetical protein
MKVLNEKTLKSGARRVTVEIDPSEKLLAIREGRFYRLGYPLDSEIVEGHHLTLAIPVSWCVIGQEWVE